MSDWGDGMGYYSNLHIVRQNDWKDYDRSDWGNVNEYLLEDLCAELEVCNAQRPKDWNAQHFAVGLAKATALRERIEMVRDGYFSMLFVYPNFFIMKNNLRSSG